ncbi:MAG: hypothetical protein QOF07_1797 [Bradyrhizobium sp.]|jgi:hypothetical protein|nr:hypothetical protein [Bradyrhizobium sp.]
METSILTGARIEAAAPPAIFGPSHPLLTGMAEAATRLGCTRSRRDPLWDRERERKSLFCREDQVADGMRRIASPAPVKGFGLGNPAGKCTPEIASSAAAPT